MRPYTSPRAGQGSGAEGVRRPDIEMECRGYTVRFLTEQSTVLGDRIHPKRFMPVDSPFLEGGRGFFPLLWDSAPPQRSREEPEKDCLRGVRLHPPTRAGQSTRCCVTLLVARRTESYVLVVGAQVADQGVLEKVRGCSFLRLNTLTGCPCRSSLSARP